MIMVNRIFVKPMGIINEFLETLGCLFSTRTHSGLTGIDSLSRLRVSMSGVE